MVTVKRSLLLCSAGAVVFMQLQLGFNQRSDPRENHGAVLSSQQPRSENQRVLNFIRRKQFPLFEKSGIILFYHIPKTGGTTIVKMITQHMPHVRLVRVSRHQQLRTLSETHLEPLWKNDPQQIVFVELHGRIQGLPVWREQLRQWRRSCKKHHIPMFAFTLLREPSSFHVSYFVHFHNCHWNWCERAVVDTSRVTNLFRVAQPNLQCQLLWYGQRENKKRIPPPDVAVTKDHCDDAKNSLVQDWDWVGTTERLQDVTLPLLSYLLLQNATIGRQMAVWNRRRFKNQTSSIQWKDLDAATLQRIRDMSYLDVELYDYFRHEEETMMSL